MSRKIYKIELIEMPPIYKTSRKEMDDWVRRNPGEMQSWSLVDPLEEIAGLQEALEEVNNAARNDGGYYCPGCGNRTMEVIEKIKTEDETKIICACECSDDRIVHLFERRS